MSPQAHAYVYGGSAAAFALPPHENEYDTQLRQQQQQHFDRSHSHAQRVPLQDNTNTARPNTANSSGGRRSGSHKGSKTHRTGPTLRETGLPSTRRARSNKGSAAQNTSANASALNTSAASNSGMGAQGGSSSSGTAASSRRGWDDSVSDLSSLRLTRQAQLERHLRMLSKPQLLKIAGIEPSQLRAQQHHQQQHHQQQHQQNERAAHRQFRDEHAPAKDDTSRSAETSTTVATSLYDGDSSLRAVQTAALQAAAAAGEFKQHQSALLLGGGSTIDSRLPTHTPHGRDVEDSGSSRSAAADAESDRAGTSSSAAADDAAGSLGAATAASPPRHRAAAASGGGARPVRTRAQAVMTTAPPQQHPAHSVPSAVERNSTATAVAAATARTNDALHRARSPDRSSATGSIDSRATSSAPLAFSPLVKGKQQLAPVAESDDEDEAATLVRAMGAANYEGDDGSEDEDDEDDEDEDGDEEDSGTSAAVATAAHLAGSAATKAAGSSSGSAAGRAPSELDQRGTQMLRAVHASLEQLQHAPARNSNNAAASQPQQQQQAATTSDALSAAATGAAALVPLLRSVSSYLADVQAQRAADEAFRHSLLDSFAACSQQVRTIAQQLLAVESDGAAMRRELHELRQQQKQQQQQPQQQERPYRREEPLPASLPPQSRRSRADNERSRAHAEPASNPRSSHAAAATMNRSAAYDTAAEAHDEDAAYDDDMAAPVPRLYERLHGRTNDALSASVAAASAHSVLQPSSHLPPQYDATEQHRLTAAKPNRTFITTQAAALASAAAAAGNSSNHLQRSHAGERWHDGDDNAMQVSRNRTVYSSPRGSSATAGDRRQPRQQRLEAALPLPSNHPDVVAARSDARALQQQQQHVRMMHVPAAAAAASPVARSAWSDEQSDEALGVFSSPAADESLYGDGDGSMDSEEAEEYDDEQVRTHAPLPSVPTVTVHRRAR